MNWLFGWIKRFGAKKIILAMDELEPVIAEKLTEAQKKFGSIPPKEFAKTLVDDIQRKLCAKLGVDPKEVGL
jgi:F0F1-type ATP synthase membrane subunit b/b'